jgi:ubiquinone/menaquinone biosynthesis C-methylase UbiE
MKQINSINLNDANYWDKNIAKPKFGIRQKKYLELAGKGNKIIELGCGLSPFLNKARKNFKECAGLDFSTKTIIEARNRFPKVEYIYGDCTKTNFKDKEFDVSVAGELIEHLEDPQKLIDEMKRITKKRIILSTAKMEYNDPEHLWEFTKEDLERWGKVEEIKSDWFPGRSYLFLTIDL